MRLEEEAPWKMGLCFYLKRSCQQKEKGNSSVTPPPTKAHRPIPENLGNGNCACRDHRLTHYKRRENKFSVRALRNWMSMLAGPTLDPGLVKPFSSLSLSLSHSLSPSFPSLFSTVITPHPFKT